MLRNNFPRGELSASFFQVDSHFAFPVQYTFLTRHYFVLLCLYSCAVYSTCHLSTTYKFYSFFFPFFKIQLFSVFMIKHLSLPILAYRITRSLKTMT